MSEFKGTRGEVYIVFKDRFTYIIADENKTISIAIKNTDNVDFDLANANLIVDAFKVRQQINCELSELLEFVKYVEKTMPTGSSLQEKAEQLIKKVKDNE